MTLPSLLQLLVKYSLIGSPLFTLVDFPSARPRDLWLVVQTSPSHHTFLLSCCCFCMTYNPPRLPLQFRDVCLPPLRLCACVWSVEPVWSLFVRFYCPPRNQVMSSGLRPCSVVPVETRDPYSGHSSGPDRSPSVRWTFSRQSRLTTPVVSIISPLNSLSPSVVSKAQVTQVTPFPLSEFSDGLFRDNGSVLT